MAGARRRRYFGKGENIDARDLQDREERPADPVARVCHYNLLHQKR